MKAFYKNVGAYFKILEANFYLEEGVKASQTEGKFYFKLVDEFYTNSAY